MGRRGGDVSFRVRGAYLESCNCEAICPCRMIGGVPGGRSTYGVCFGLLTWQIEDGWIGDVDVGGLAVALVCAYDDDEEGSPWTVELHLDSRGSDEQRAALERLFLDGLGGPHTAKLPWIRKARHLIGVRTSEIVLAPGSARVGPEIRLRATQPVEDDVPVACAIPGYEQVGRELYADELAVGGFELRGNCAYETVFDYVSA
jgi:Protein of unknown function (DUF1326)